MPTHGVITARPKGGLHLAAGVTQAGVFQHHTPDSERFAFQGQEVQARDHNVAPENVWVKSIPPEAGGNGMQVLFLGSG